MNLTKWYVVVHVIVVVFDVTIENIVLLSTFIVIWLLFKSRKSGFKVTLQMHIEYCLHCMWSFTEFTEFIEFCYDVLFFLWWVANNLMLCRAAFRTMENKIHWIIQIAKKLYCNLIFPPFQLERLKVKNHTFVVNLRLMPKRQIV